MNKLHDIKPLVAIPDVSLYYFSALITLSIVITVALGYFLLKLFNKKRSLHDIYLEKLDHLVLEDAKRDAYNITRYANHLQLDPNTKRMLDNLNEKLSAYKYKKEVASFSDAIKRDITLFLEVVHNKGEYHDIPK
jgi:predicted CopG family antitoxin